jgi:hypothetical protein
MGIVGGLAVIAATVGTAASMSAYASPGGEPTPGELPCGGGQVVSVPMTTLLVPGITGVMTYCASAPDLTVDGHVLHAVVPVVQQPSAPGLSFVSGPPR